MKTKSTDRRKKFFKERVVIYRSNPVAFAQEVLLFQPDEWQTEALQDLADSPKVAIKSGQGVGKTGMEAVALLWFLCCFPYPRIVATAPTKQQLHDVLWSEVSKWMGKSPLLTEILKWTKTYIYMVGNEKRWFAVARTATKPENMQGFHEDNMLFIVDEASGVADPLPLHPSGDGDYRFYGGGAACHAAHALRGIRRLGHRPLPAAPRLHR